MLFRGSFNSIPHNILSKPLAAFPHNSCETTDSGARGMNPVALTIINPRREYWPSHGSNQRPPVLKSATLPTELWGSAHLIGLVRCMYLTLIIYLLDAKSIDLLFCSKTFFLKVVKSRRCMADSSLTLFQPTNFTLFQTGRVCRRQISNLVKMAESSPNG